MSAGYGKAIIIALWNKIVSYSVSVELIFTLCVSAFIFDPLSTGAPGGIGFDVNSLRCGKFESS
jgi:hypothetical protein